MRFQSYARQLPGRKVRCAKPSVTEVLHPRAIALARDYGQNTFTIKAATLLLGASSKQRVAPGRFRLWGPMNLEPVGQPKNLNDGEQEARNIRRLQIMISMVMSVIGQDPNLTLEEAAELVAGARKAALAMFPDKELAYDLIYKPRLQRLMNERFRLQ